MAKGTVATAVARKLVYDVADLGGLLIDVDLPGILEVLAAELCAREDWRQRGDLQWSRGVVGRNFIGRIGPLRVANGGEGGDGDAKNQFAIEGHLRMCSLAHFRPRWKRNETVGVC